MHELSLAQNIIDIVREYLPDDNQELKEVHVRIGALIAVVPESLQFCYDTLVQDTPFAGSKMVIQILPVKAVCQQCSHTLVVKEMVFICPRCGSKDLKIIQGNELTVSHLEVN